MTTSDEARDTRPPRSPDGPSGRKRWAYGVLLVVAVYAAGLMVVGVRDALDALAAAAWPALAGALLLEVVTVGSFAMVHRSSAAAVRGRLRYGQALNVSMSAFTVTQTLPGGGAVAGVVAVRRLQRLGLDGPSATASVALTATLALGTITGIAAVGVAVAVVDAELPVLALAPALALFVLLLGAAVGIVVMLRSPRLERRLLDLLGRLHERIRERLDDWRSSLSSLNDAPPAASDLGRIVAWSALKWSADIAALWLVFVALGSDVDVHVLLIGFGVSQVGTAIPATPGGVGFVESGMVGAFVALGEPASTATAIVLVYRVLATWLPALAGVPALLRPPEPAEAG